MALAIFRPANPATEKQSVSICGGPVGLCCGMEVHVSMKAHHWKRAAIVLGILAALLIASVTILLPRVSRVCLPQVARQQYTLQSAERNPHSYRYSESARWKASFRRICLVEAARQVEYHDSSEAQLCALPLSLTVQQSCFWRSSCPAAWLRRVYRRRNVKGCPACCPHTLNYIPARTP